MRKDATIELLEDIVKELEAESSIPQAARELAIAIVQSNLSDADEKVIYFQRIITAALKRCRNEALEEAAKCCSIVACEKPDMQRYEGAAECRKDILKLKEAE